MDHSEPSPSFQVTAVFEIFSMIVIKAACMIVQKRYVVVSCDVFQYFVMCRINYRKLRRHCEDKFYLPVTAEVGKPLKISDFHIVNVISRSLDYRFLGTLIRLGQWYVAIIVTCLSVHD